MWCCSRGGGGGGGRRALLSLWTVVLCGLSIAGMPDTGSTKIDLSDAFNVSAVVGGEASLPCDARAPPPPDALLLAVWYRDDLPIYSFDGRVQGAAAHWADPALATRARWQLPPPAPAPATLRLRRVAPSDAGRYRCRVDFKLSPTRNYNILLDVIEPPEKPKIFDENNTEINGVAGPYEEDGSLKLTCVVSGGKPTPRLRWWRAEEAVATLAPRDARSTPRALELHVPRLTRQHLDARYTCTADNSALLPPPSAHVQILLYLRPLFVEIVAREQPLAVGRAAELVCRSAGARPPARLTWSLAGQRMPDEATQQISADRNESASVLRWAPRMEHDGAELACRAAHAHLPHSTIETTMTLSLHYAPIVSLRLDSQLNPHDIEEGDDVHLECAVRANPPAYKVVWQHNGQVLGHSQRAGGAAGSARLPLRAVSRARAGRYACVASNVEGDGSSPPLDLQVIYKPMCRNNQTGVVGAAVNESTEIICEVDAFPPPTDFQWTLNNSLGSFEIDPANFTIDASGRSVLTYRPGSERDYGSLGCRATNLAGPQPRPCHYRLLPAARPDPPRHCRAANLTHDAADLTCAPGDDGGTRARYYLEVWEGGAMVANLSSAAPGWRLRGLPAGRPLRLALYAANAAGCSPVQTLRINTLPAPALQTDDVTVERSLATSWALVAAVAGSAVLAVLAAAAGLARRRGGRAALRVPMQPLKTQKGGSHQSPGLPDDRNPDVIPLGKDFNCTRDSSGPLPPPYGMVVSNPVASSRSASSLHNEHASTLVHTPNTPASDVQSIATIADQRSIASGTLPRRRTEVVTTRTPLLHSDRESCV